MFSLLQVGEARLSMKPPPVPNSLILSRHPLVANGIPLPLQRLFFTIPPKPVNMHPHLGAATTQVQPASTIIYLWVQTGSTLWKPHDLFMAGAYLKPEKS